MKNTMRLPRALPWITPYNNDTGCFDALSLSLGDKSFNLILNINYVILLRIWWILFYLIFIFILSLQHNIVLVRVVPWRSAYVGHGWRDTTWWCTQQQNGKTYIHSSQLEHRLQWRQNYSSKFNVRESGADRSWS